jgi:hypothetical protein
LVHVVYIPAADAPEVADLAPGSGIVGERQDDGSVLIDFEGNLVGAPALELYANRVLKAAARQDARYPTRARRIVSDASLIAVGEFDSREQVVRLTGPDSERVVAEWLGLGEIDHTELIARR